MQCSRCGSHASFDVPECLCCVQLYPQATWSQHCNFVCEHPDDEKLLMDTFRAQNLRSNVISMQPGAGVPVGDAARFRDYGVIATLDEVGFISLTARRMSCVVGVVLCGRTNCIYCVRSHLAAHTCTSTAATPARCLTRCRW